MKYLLFIILILCRAGYGNDNPNAALFRIIQDNKTGYIDSLGNIVIEPVFTEAFNFSDGLAPARISGKYGYINTKGNFAVQPKYEYAMEFRNGTALVFHDTISAFLFKDGKEIQFRNYKAITFYEPERAYVFTFTNKTGVIDLKGNLVIDTIYRSINFHGQFATVTGFNIDASVKWERYEVGLIDNTGKIIIPFGRYYEIWNFERGCARVFFSSDTVNFTGFVNENGHLKISKLTDGMQAEELSACINDSTFVVVCNDSVDYQRGRSSTSDYYGIINSKGESIIKNRNWREIRPISENLCAVRLADYTYTFIDDKGIGLKGDALTRIRYEIYDSSIIAVRDNEYALMDLNLKFIIHFQEYELRSNYIGKNFFYYSMHNGKGWGLNDFNDNTIIPPGPYTFTSADFKNEILGVIKDESISYFNMSGEEIWKGDDSKESFYLNIDYMKWANHCVSEQDNKIFFSRRITKEDKFLKDFLSLRIDEVDTVSYEDRFKGLILNLANHSDNKMSFNTQDNRLEIILQARDRNGKWRNIEFIMNSFCGNSYYPIQMEKNMRWSFVIPLFDGELKTVMRAELNYSNPNDRSQHYKLYSNEVKCGINPAQFWRKKELFINGVMRPDYF